MAKNYKQWEKYAHAEMKRKISQEGWIKIFLKLAIPVAIAVTAAVIIGGFGQTTTMKYGALTAFYFSPLGMEIGVPFAVSIGVPLLNAVLFEIFLDMICAMWLVWNLNWARLIPGVGKLIKRSEDWGARQTEKHPYLKELEFIGLIIFVVVPLWGSGAIMGSIIGNLIGMKPLPTWCAVILGTTIRLTIIGLIVSGILLIL